MAKRCNYIGITKCEEAAGYGYYTRETNRYPFIQEISIWETRKKENNISIDFDWTKNFIEIEELFKSDDIEEIKEELPMILKKQGWIK